MDENTRISDEPAKKYFQIMQLMDNLYEEYARKNNLTYISLYILETIYDLKKCTQKEISEITLYPKQTINMVISSFLKKNWVVLEQASDDRRSKSIMFTNEGTDAAERILEPFRNAVNCAFSELNSEHRQVMLDELSVFAQIFAEKARKL